MHTFKEKQLSTEILFLYTA